MSAVENYDEFDALLEDETSSPQQAQPQQATQAPPQQAMQAQPQQAMQAQPQQAMQAQPQQAMQAQPQQAQPQQALQQQPQPSGTELDKEEFVIMETGWEFTLKRAVAVFGMVFVTLILIDVTDAGRALASKIGRYSFAGPEQDFGRAVIAATIVSAVAYLDVRNTADVVDA